MNKSILFNPTLHKKYLKWDCLFGASLPLSLSEYCLQSEGVSLLITSDNLKARQLLDEIQFFVPAQTPCEILLFPDWETLPYDQFSPHHDIVSDRLSVLNRMQQTKHAIVIAAANTLMHRLPPKEFLLRHSLSLCESQTLNITLFKQHLIEAGYHLVNKVLEHGEFAVRGAIIDLFPMGAENPYRIELFDDEIQSLRSFDPDTQCTIEKLPRIQILPAHEFAMDEEGIMEFRRNFREHFSGNPSHCPLYEAVSQGQSPNGIEYYLPLFFKKTLTFFDYLPKDATLFFIENIAGATEQFWQEIQTRFEQRNYDITRPILAPTDCFLPPSSFFTACKPFASIHCASEITGKKTHTHCFPVQKTPHLFINRHSQEPLQSFAQYVKHRSDFRVLLVVESAGRREVLLDLLKPSNLVAKVQPDWNAFLQDDLPIHITIGQLSEGAEFIENKVAILVEGDLFGQMNTPQKKSSQKGIDPDVLIRDLAEIRIGCPVVHIQFGIGRYQGLQYIESNGSLNEF